MASDYRSAGWKGFHGEDAWRVLGELTRLRLAVDARRETDPHDLVNECLSRLEVEFSDWLQRPLEVLIYVLASRAPRKNKGSTDPPFWGGSHRAVWVSLYNPPAPMSAPPGVRVLCFVEPSLDAFISSHIGRDLRAFFTKISHDSLVARRVVICVQRASEALWFPSMCCSLATLESTVNWKDPFSNSRILVTPGSRRRMLFWPRLNQYCRQIFSRVLSDGSSKYDRRSPPISPHRPNDRHRTLGRRRSK